MNEELETAKEELQSTNEELSTVNDELNNRNFEISELNSDLNNLLGSINVAVVLVDNSLNNPAHDPIGRKVVQHHPKRHREEAERH